MIMKVACFFDQHSPILGQPASSQTVTNFMSRTSFCVSVKTGEPGALTLIQSGLRNSGVSALWAFSGCRGRAPLPMSISVAKASAAPLDGAIRKDEHASAQYRHDQLNND